MTAPGPATRRRSAWVLAAVGGLVLLGAGAVSASASASVATKAKPAAITIKNFAFKPTPLTVKAGTKITVTNKDGTTHTLTSDTGKFDAGSIDGGNSASIMVKKPGTYKYHCEIHDFMKGTIKVT
jgi:plastocyanin